MPHSLSDLLEFFQMTKEKILFSTVENSGSFPSHTMPPPLNSCIHKNDGFIESKHHSISISAKQYLADIQVLQHKILAAPQQRWVLCYENSYLFSVALFAVLATTREPILLPNNQCGTVADFRHAYDALLTDIPVLKSQAFDFPSTSEIPPVAVTALNESRTFTFFTSGTTGAPKKVVRTLQQMMAEITTLELTFGAYLNNVVIYTSVSYQHIYGLLFSLLWPLCAGRTIYLPRLHYPEQLETMAANKQKIALISSPALLKRITTHKINANHIIIFSSGGPLPANTAANIYHSLGSYLIDILGSTETGAVAYRKKTNPRRYNFNWTALPNVQVSSSHGCLAVSSPFSSQRDLFVIGDKVKFNADASFQLLERVDRIVKIEEKRVSLIDIENRLQQHTLIRDAYALPIETKRQYIAVIICLTQAGKEILTTQNKSHLNNIFKRYLNDYFDPILLPRQFRYLDKIPTNAQGKYVLADLKKIFDQEPLKYPIVLAEQACTEKNKITLQLFLPKNIIYFNGHFPTYPILPGIVQTDWALFFAQRYFSVHKTDFLNVQQLKFTQVVFPEETIFLRLALENGSLIFKYFNNTTTYSSGKLKTVA